MTEKERKVFEAALGTAWQKYRDGARLVDRFEDNYIECAFSKGFFQGYITANEIRKIVNAETSANKV